MANQTSKMGPHYGSVPRIRHCGTNRSGYRVILSGGYC